LYLQFNSWDEEFAQCQNQQVRRVDSHTCFSGQRL